MLQQDPSVLSKRLSLEKNSQTDKRTDRFIKNNLQILTDGYAYECISCLTR